MTEHAETIVVGGGQAGLATAYHLKRLGREVLVLDGSERIGDGWRTRWDSLRLFTPAKYDGLPGLRFPAPPNSFPTKDEMADYLEDYAERFELPVRTGMRVESVTKAGDRYVVRADGRRFEADNVVVASGAHGIPRVPAFASDLDPGIVQLHSVDYRSPAQLQDGPVLLVGLGNSGAEIAYEVAQTHPTYVSGKPSAQIPFEHGPRAARFALPMVRFLGLHVLTVRTPIGRKVRPKFVQHAAPLIRVKVKHLRAAGVEQVARTAGVRDGQPVLEDGRVLDVRNVIWSTGFSQDLGWLDVPVFDGDGAPRHRRGIVEEAPGLYFVGLLFQYAAASDTLPGVGRDAGFVAKHIDARARAQRRTSSALIRSA